MNNRKIAWYYCGVRETMSAYIWQYFMVCCIYFIITGFFKYYIFFLCVYFIHYWKTSHQVFQMGGHLSSTSLCGCHCRIGYGKFGRVTNKYIFYLHILFWKRTGNVFFFVYLLSGISPWWPCGFVSSWITKKKYCMLDPTEEL